jgi:hypothetical protein
MRRSLIENSLAERKKGKERERKKERKLIPKNSVKSQVQCTLIYL